jgi:F-type H+-transporting ATPase subunit b
MEQIVNQLRDLFLGAVPTIVLFLLLVVAYGFLVRRPLEAVLAERRKLTTGAVEAAQSAIQQAETETALYEEKLRSARSDVFNARDERIKQWAVEREKVIGEVRAETHEKVVTAQLAIEKNAAAVRQQIEGMSTELSAQVLKAVLPPEVAGTGAAQ